MPSTATIIGSIEASTHTPGPWVARRALKPVDGEYDFAISAHNGGARCLAEAFGRAADAEGTKLPAEANARLIAAAPDLLEALKAAPDMGAFYTKDADGKVTGFDRTGYLLAFDSWCGVRNAAIAKAEGRS